jgi:hypothetical protein
VSTTQKLVEYNLESPTPQDMPQSICSLPVEVVLKILDNLIIQDDGSTASIGNGAIYTLPSNRLDKTLSPFSDEHGHVPVGDLNLLYPIKILRTYVIDNSCRIWTISFVADVLCRSNFIHLLEVPFN